MVGLSLPVSIEIPRVRGFARDALALTADAVDLDVFSGDTAATVAWPLELEAGAPSPAAISRADLTERTPMAKGADYVNVTAASAVTL